MRNRSVSNRRSGQILPLFALLLALLLLPVAGLAVDGGTLVSDHATLVGAVQAAAEAGSQALDVTALTNRDTYALCAIPDGGEDCGNGIGSVSDLIETTLAASYPSLGRTCTLVPLSAIAGAGRTGPGCDYALLADCRTANSGPRPAPDPLAAAGVEVAAWNTVGLPLLAFGAWKRVAVRATSDSWLEHGFGPASARVGSGPIQC
ncbi:MAG: pilus assembly protein TadG-related protein [Candidatus Dormibacteria bacterium]